MARTAVGTRVDGLAAVVRDLQQMGLQVEDLKGAFAPIAAQGARIIAGYVPELTGRAKASVRGNRAKNKAVVTAGRASLPYIGPLNYGWPAHNIDALGFMQRGDEEMRPLALRRLEREINTQIRRRGLA